VAVVTPSSHVTPADLERLRHDVAEQLVALREECQKLIEASEARAVRKASERVARRLS